MMFNRDDKLIYLVLGGIRAITLVLTRSQMYYITLNDHNVRYITQAVGYQQ